MSPPQRLNAQFKAHFVLVLLAAVALGAAFPRLGLALKDLRLFSLPGGRWAYDFPNLALGLMMLSASVQCELRDFRRLADRPRGGIVSLVVFYFLVPALAALWGLVGAAVLPERIGLQLEIGVMLSALMPVAMTSSVWGRMTGGNLPQLIALITFTTAWSLLSVPAYLSVLLGVSGSAVDVPTGTIVEQLVLSTTAPLLLGLSLRRLAPGWAVRLGPWLDGLANLSLLAVVVANVAVAAPHIRVEGAVVAAMLVFTVGLNLSCYAVGLLLARWLGLAREDAIALLFGSGMRSNSTGLVIGLKSFPAMPLVAVPAAVYMISQHVIGAYVTRLLDRADSRLLGLAIAAEPSSLERFLARALPRVRPTGLALVVAQLSGPQEEVAAAMRRFAVRARRRVRLSDFVCWLAPNRVGVVLVDSDAQGSALVVERLVRVAGQCAPGMTLECGAAHAQSPSVSAAELIAAAAPEPPAPRRQAI